MTVCGRSDRLAPTCRSWLVLLATATACAASPPNGPEEIAIQCGGYEDQLVNRAWPSRDVENSFARQLGDAVKAGLARDRDFVAVYPVDHFSEARFAELATRYRAQFDMSEFNRLSNAGRAIAEEQARDEDVSAATEFLLSCARTYLVLSR